MKKLFLFVLLTCAVCSISLAQSPFKDRWFVAGMGFNIAGCVADLTSTQAVLNSGHGYEANPVIGRHGERLVPVKIGMTALSIWGAHYLHRHGHPKRAAILLFIGGGVQFGAATWNRSQLR